MRKDFGAKPLTCPQPVFIIGTYNEDGSPNAMNAAWGGISDETQIALCLGDDHKTVENLLKRKAFTVSMGAADWVASCDYVGIVSGKKVADKFKKSGFHEEKSCHVDAPLIQELPIAVECRLISYDAESARLLGEIINVAVDEEVLTDEGKVDVEKAMPLIFDPFQLGYHVVGRKVGQAYKEGLVLK